MKSDNLQLKELVIGRDDVAMLPPISLQLNPGEMLMIRGRNGSGKSSLLKCIAGLLQPMDGMVQWGNVAMGEHALYPYGILYLGHKRGLDLSMSVKANVSFWAKAYRQPELIDAALHYFDLEDIADTAVHQLSAGWQQRVALTKLITQPGAIWLLDEPTANLDGDGLALLHSLIQTRIEQGGIVVVASHVSFDGPRVRLLDLDQLSPGLNDVHDAGGLHVAHLH
jgi:heme exporter protein A